MYSPQDMRRIASLISANNKKIAPCIPYKGRCKALLNINQFKQLSFLEDTDIGTVAIQ